MGTYDDRPLHEIKTMKALVLENYNTPFELKEIPNPVAGPGQVLVKVHASGVNPLDLKIMAGQAAHAQTRLPAILGIDLAGEVVAVGNGVTRFKPGDGVYGMTGGIAGVPGSLAEFAAVDADLLAIKPQSLSMREVAALPLIVITAWEAIIDKANIQPGQTILVHGGAGGVGHIAVQLAKAKGANVYATVRPESEALILKYGATPIDYTSLSTEEYVHLHTQDQGFDIILDTVGGLVLDASFKAAKRYTGHVVSILGWGAHSLAPLSFRSATYSGVFTLYPLISGQGRAHHGEILKAATALIDEGRITPLVHGRTFTLAQIADAYRSVQQGKTNGKIVVTVE
jgi:NADPH:quinone reductase-like Zn-dependent oxidoreductase